METWPQPPGNEAHVDEHRRAELAYLRASADASSSIAALLAARPDSLPAHLLAIAKLVAAKDAAALPQLARALEAAAPFEREADSRALAHLAAARAWLARAPLQAA